MAQSKEEILRNPEFKALQDLEGIDPDQLITQVDGNSDEDIKTPPEGGKQTPEGGKQTPEGGTQPPEGGTTPPEGGKQPPEVGTQTPEGGTQPTNGDELVKEIFGDRFKTIDEVKEANVAGILDEVESLRQAKAELEEKLSQKPKSAFVDDEVALYNEFVKQTGVKNYGVFQKINNMDVSKMEPIDVFVIDYILKNPEMAGNEARIKKHFERKYNVDPEIVDDEEELKTNMIGLTSDSAAIRKELAELKSNLKVPEPSQEQEPESKELTPEEKKELEKGWSEVGDAVGTVLSNLKIPIKNSKEPLLDYELSESEQKEISQFIRNYALENHLELNDANKRMVGIMVRNQLVLNKLPEIVHSVFEKARSLTEEEVHKLYENPSPAKNNDTPPEVPGGVSEEEKQEEEIFKAEMGRYDI